ncbi:MAG: cyclophilin-like fold protein [Atopobiaceae bacterium]|nr:cyclophilin-like fold protein [Atopobiaceae bacterium]
MLTRRSLLQGAVGLLAFGLAGCGRKDEAPSEVEVDFQATEEEPTEDEGEAGLNSEPEAVESTAQEEVNPMQISVTINGTAFTATLDDGVAGQQMLERLPMSLHMEELHGNEKYSYTGEPFDGEEYLPTTIEAGDLMVYGGDCLVLFYETFDNDRWQYQRVGKIDDVSKLAEVCGKNSVYVDFEQLQH